MNRWLAATQSFFEHEQRSAKLTRLTLAEVPLADPSVGTARKNVPPRWRL